MLEKYDNVTPTLTRQFWGLITKRIASILGEGNSGIIDMVVLPESVRYALRYRNANFMPEEALALLDEKYGFLGVYVCLKFYEKNLDKLHEHLHEIFQGIRSGKSFYEYTQQLRTDVGSLQKSHTIVGTKSAQVSRNGFVPMCEGIAQVFNESKKGGIPVLVAFSGLLGIKGIIQEMTPGEIFYIFFPKNSPEESFLRVSCSHDTVHLARLHENQLREVFHEKEIILVDDTQKTGSTFDEAEARIKKFCEPKSTTKRSLVVASREAF